MDTPRYLIYTIAFDRKGEAWHSMMARLLALSLFRTGFSGELLIFTNGLCRIIVPEHPRIREVTIASDGISDADFILQAMQFKFRARRLIPIGEGFEKIMFVDCDSLFLKRPEPLFDCDADVMFAQEPFSSITGPGNNAYLSDNEMRALRAPGINAGLLWVRTEYFIKIMAHWERIDDQPPLRRKHFGDQPAWVRVIRDTKLNARPFRFNSDVRYPFIEQRNILDFSAATLLHFAANRPEAKVAHMLGASLHYCVPEQIESIASGLRFSVALNERSPGVNKADGTLQASEAPPEQGRTASCHEARIGG